MTTILDFTKDNTMYSSFFGSFAKRTFCDLFDLNYRSCHTILHIFEIFDKEIINHNVVSLPITEEVDEGNVATCFKKYKNSSYMLGFLSDNSDKINTVMVNNYNKAHLLDTLNDKSMEYCINRNKEFIYIVLSENNIGVFLVNKQSVYIEHFHTIPATPMSEFDEYKPPEITFIDVMNIKND
mgnify:CR=1 FL=1